MKYNFKNWDFFYLSIFDGLLLFILYGVLLVIWINYGLVLCFVIFLDNY